MREGNGESRAAVLLCRGAGEGALLDLVEALEQGKDYRNIPNLWVRGQNGEICKNDPRPLIADLDALPFWDREVFHIGAHLQKEGALGITVHKGIMPVAAGRGCPFRCTYCTNEPLQEIYRGKGIFVRKRSVENIISELKTLKENYPVEVFEFWDEDFSV